MEYIRVSRRLKDYGAIAELMRTAFPPEERIPLWVLTMLSKQRNVNFNAWYAHGSLCGITYTIESAKMVFLLYFAVQEQLRSQGYGSRIIEEIKKLAGKREIILNVEKPDEQAENNVQRAQRIQRIAFYERNGFYQSDFALHIEGTDYLVLSTNMLPDKKEFSDIITRYRIGEI